LRKTNSERERETNTDIEKDKQRERERERERLSHADKNHFLVLENASSQN
jgi:hypothetical protein